MKTMQAALNYAGKNNYSIIPLQRNKKPYFQWTDFQHRKASSDEIKAWWSKWPNAMIGIVTGQISGLFVVDCDTQKGFDTVQELLPDSLEIPTARTPRGGWHLYFQYPTDSGLTVQAAIMPGVDIRGEGGYIIAAPSMNGNGKGYEWLDGLSLAEITPPPLPNALLSAFNNIINNSIYRGEVKTEVSASKMFENGRRDNDLFHVSNCLVKGGMPKEEIEQVLEKLIFSWGENPDSKWIQAKIESAFQRANKRERNLAKEVLDFISVTNGYFSVTDCYTVLQVVTKEDKTAVRVALSRLKDKDKVIEKHGNKDGVYRRIENEIEEVNFLNAPTDEFSISLPLGIDSYCKLYPGNIVVVAGSKSSGKTAFLLNIVKENMKRYEVVYLNSEMGDTEFRKRLELFEDVKLQDWKFRAYHRMANFADLITPEKKIFIVDFLEVTTDFWKVAQYIQEIHRKLKEGICIIALQKSEGKDNGRGGDFSKEKARLYIALDYLPEQKTNRLKIVDAKAWQTEINPRGMFREYKLIHGSKFVKESKWQN
ncbi:MAG TPA: bifunctional DNA primase/polymerase [Smithella sp.]|nr:bifunctional DNA primase/polymerase [Smithella sp.]HOX98475.1 bifunctional DNA primase/polymerase [Smithella sp.]HPN85803.1 bifunctional DNA primase/polymerase [Smithella sp.]HPX30764.1 bifunctional DNA primase/polymerase [Smithella sp.]